MVQVFPFRGVHFSPQVVGDLSKVTSQPYDKISDALKREYYERHPNHIVRILCGKDEASDHGAENRYTRARGFLDEWLGNGVLIRDEKPSFYAYRQVYQTADGPKTRQGLTAMVRVEEPGKGKVLPHEQTHIGPKVDRFKLLNNTMTHFGHIFLLYSDPERKVNAILNHASAGSAPLASRDDFGETHQAWPVADPADIQAIQDAMGDQVAIIADGHHRYETSWKFRLDLEKAGAREQHAESHLNVLATLVNLEDEGLTMYPTHRVVDEVEGYSLDGFKRKLSEFFDVSSVPADGAAIDRALAEAPGTAFGIIDRDADEFLVATLRDAHAAAGRIPGEHSREWKLLGVNILHSVILEPMLGVTPDDLEHERRVTYFRHTREVLDAVRTRKEARVGLLVKPCSVDEILTLTKRGERFPQKTTDFYPKLLSGFIMCRLDVSREGLEKLK